MNESTEIIPREHGHAMTVREVTQQAGIVMEAMKTAMVNNMHYGVIPGCGSKPTLLKPGAEKLCLLFGFASQLKVERDDLPNGHREYGVTCTLINRNTGEVIGEGVGCCSSMESKYRYRNEWVNKVKTKVENENVADQFNTLLKMAKKRALVDAVLTATAASDVFTQDLEDMKANGITTETKQDPGTGDAPSGDGVITDKQRKLIYAKTQEAGIDNDEFRYYLHEKYKIESSKDLPFAAMDTVLADIKRWNTEGVDVINE